MSRRHLESALVAGGFIESGLTPCFRFTRIRFVRYCFPPGYEISKNSYETAGDNDDEANRESGEALFNASSSITATCTCCTEAKNVQEDQRTSQAGSESVISMLGHGDCEMPEPKSTTACKLHREEYLRKNPWRRLQDDYGVHSVQFNPDGTQLLAGSANTSVRVIQTSDGAQRILARPSKWTLGMPVTVIRFMPPKFIWAVGCNSHGEVFGFKPNSEGFETLFKEPQQTYTLDFSSDGLELATAGVDKKIRIYTLQQGSVVGLPTLIKDDCADQDGPVTRNRIIAERIQALTLQSTKVDLPKQTRYHFPGGRPEHIVDITAKPFVLTRCFGTSDISSPADFPGPAGYVNDPKSVPPVREYVPTSPGTNITEGHSMRIMALRYHPQKNCLLFSAGWDNLVKLWDTRLQSGPVWQIYGPHVASPDGLDVDDNYLLTASWRAKDSIEIWDLRKMNSSTGKLLASQLCNEQVSRQPVPLEEADDDLCSARNSIVTDEPTENKPLSGHAGAAVEAPQPRPGGPAEVIPISGSVWVSHPSKENGEYPYAARLLPSRAVVAGGSGFHGVRVVGRDTLLPIARIPMDSVVQCMDTILEGRYIGVGCSSGTVSIIGLA
ncbi:hypothetical protein T265_09592 [Opisthorchis viverrini]|nr:hypothetical protein T265_09592 [Opisthorchis viverrini]KER22262.1 hypothetical protein T265_09592 [Opisthorchis viverrini]